MSHIPSDPATVRGIVRALRDLSISTGVISYCYVPMIEFTRRSELIVALLEIAEGDAASTHFDDGRPIREFWGTVDGQEWRIHVAGIFDGEMPQDEDSDDE